MYVPSGWKQSLVVPISKSNDNTDLPNNCRPISLLSVLSKLLERHVHKLLADHLSTHYPLSNSQWGVSEGKSTVTALPPMNISGAWKKGRRSVQYSLILKGL